MCKTWHVFPAGSGIPFVLLLRTAFSRKCAKRLSMASCSHDECCYTVDDTPESRWITGRDTRYAGG